MGCCPAEPDLSLQYRVSANQFGGEAQWTRQAPGRIHARRVEMGSGAALLTFAAAGSTITRDAGSFIADGFLEGDTIVVDGSVLNDGVYTVTNVTATTLTVVEALVDEGPIGSTNILLVDGAKLTVGPLGGDYPVDGFISVDSTFFQNLVVAKYAGLEQRVLQVAGTTITLGADTFGVTWVAGSSIIVGNFADQVFINAAVVPGTWGPGGIILNSSVAIGPSVANTDFNDGVLITQWAHRVNPPSAAPPNNSAYLFYEQGTGFRAWFPGVPGNQWVLPDAQGTVAVGDSGTATLVAGTVTIAGVPLTANSRILVTMRDPGAGAITGFAAFSVPVASRNVGAGTFVINAIDDAKAVIVTATCTVDWQLVKEF